jgi:hypothetical protein
MFHMERRKITSRMFHVKHSKTDTLDPQLLGDQDIGVMITGEW